MRIKIEDLTKRYGPVRALDKVSLDIPPRRILVVLGPNGAGKTTLLNCMSGIARTDKGRILYNDEVFRRGRLDMRRRFMFLPDFPPFFPAKTVTQHIGMVLRLYEAETEGVEDKVVEILRDFDLLTLAEMPMGHLSRGQAYKAALSALVAADPELWLLDEPFASGMDPHGIMSFKKHAREARRRDRTIIYTTQLLDAARSLSDHFCVIDHGKIFASDSVARLEEMRSDDRNVLEEVFARLREEDR
jgi:ABC-type multidrug transport system ATPase subunit